jgi:hypothetical protein
MMSLSNFYSSLKLKSRWLKDLIFCSAAYFILLNIFVGSSEWQMIDHIYTSIFLATLILFGTINEWVIQNNFLKKQKYGAFLCLTALNILLGALFNQFLFDDLIDLVLPGYYFISYYEYADLLKFFFVYIFLLTLLDLSWEWFQFQETRHKMAVLQKAKTDAELRALTNQVNPHFLFNSLTVLYGLALKKSEETADAVMKLSNTLRYVIYESSRGKVKIESEISLIKNYIELQRYRVPASTKIDFKYEVKNEKLEIEPMLLLPLLENSFKHGVMTDISDSYIKINLCAGENAVSFRIVNSKGLITDLHSSGGIGLKNIEERLKLLYEGHHSLEVVDTDRNFAVNLELELAK